MSKNLIPITEFPVAAALPDYLDAERIGVNAELIGRVAQLGCFKPEVEITAHSGETTTYHAQFNGMAGPGVASAAATGTVSVAKRSKVSYEDTPPAFYDNNFSFTVRHHGVPKLTASLNTAEIQQRVQEKAHMRNTKAWAKELDGGMSEALRQAARQNILGGLTSYREAFDGALQLTCYSAAWSFLDMLDGNQTDVLGNLPWNVSFLIAISNIQKMRRENLLDPSHMETCYSLFPGLHLDRYLAVEGITRARRLIRPIK